MGEIKEDITPRTEDYSGPVVTMKFAEEPPPSIGPEQQDWRTQYERRFSDPNFQTQVWRNIWNEWTINHKEVQAEVPSCPYTKDELRELQKSGVMPIFIPAEIEIAELTSLFPKLGLERILSYASKYYYYNTAHQNGWLDVERAATPLQVGESQRKVLQSLFAFQREEMTLRTYIVSSMFNRALTGNFFDESSVKTAKNWSYLGGTSRSYKVGPTETPGSAGRRACPIEARYLLDTDPPQLDVRESIQHSLATPHYLEDYLVELDFSAEAINNLRRAVGYRSVGSPQSSPISKTFSP